MMVIYVYNLLSYRGERMSITPKQSPFRDFESVHVLARHIVQA
jgi:hypothetical protein